MTSQDWDSVEILTYAGDENMFNPVVPVLQMTNDANLFSQSNVNIHAVSGIEQFRYDWAHTSLMSK